MNLNGASARPLEILLVEDNPGDVRLVVEALRQGKLLHRLSVAENGTKALAMLRRESGHAHRTYPDLILLDLNLPGLSGHELLAEFKSDPRMARIPVVVMTSSEAHEDVARAYALHANCYVRKPVDIDRLLAIVNGVGHFWLSVVSLPEHTESDDSGTWRLLLVEDNPGDDRLVKELLAGFGAEIVHVERLADAATEIARGSFTLALVDPGLPDSEGIDTISALLRAAPLMPLVVLSGHDDEPLALQAIKLGAQDYVVKGSPDASALARSLRYAVERKLVQERLDYLATHDGVTGLPNRQMFSEELSTAIHQCHRRGSDAALMMVSLTGLDRINQLHGHDFGDLALDSFVSRLREVLPADARMASTGSAELTVMLTDVQSIMDTPQRAEKMIETASQAGRIGDQAFYFGANVGMSLFSIDSEEPSALLKCAETALYQAKSAGPNTFRFYSAQLNAAAMERLAVEHDLQHALERGEFRLYYQAVFNVATNTLCGAEALLRWQHPERGLLTPDRFLEVAEQRDLMPAIGAWAFVEACRMGKAWSSASGRFLKIAVNVSAQQLVGDEFVGVVDRAIRDSGIDPASLVVELTESMMQSAQARDNLVALRSRGVKIAIDDFGTGFSSLGYLRRFPVDVLKIDRSFLSGVPEDERDCSIVRTIIAMAQNLGLTVVAEGVETHAHLDFLRGLSCDEAQGYLLARPVHPDEFAAAFCLADPPELPAAT